MTAIILFLGTIFKKLFKKGSFEEYSVSLTGEQFTTYIDRFLRKLKLPLKGGALSDMSSFKKSVNKAYRAIAKKSLDGELYEFEKWLYENHYFVSGFFGIDLSKLPQINGVPRVVVLAKEILKVSAYSFDEKRAKEAIYLQNAIRALTYEEIKNLNNAFAYALIEKISAVSEKALLIRKLEKLACQRSKRFDKYLKSNFVRYFKTRNTDVKTDEEIVFAVNSVIVELTKVVSETFKSLRAVNAVDFSECYMPLKLLKSDSLFSKMTAKTQDAYKSKICELSDKINVSEMIFVEKLLELAFKTHEHFGEYLFNKTDVLFEYLKSGKIKEHKDLSKLKERTFICSYVVLGVLVAVGIGFAAFFSFNSVISLHGDLLPLYVNNHLSAFKIANACIFGISGFLLSNKFILKLLLLLASAFKKSRPVFMMEKSDKSALVVVSEFISNIEQFDKAVTNFEQLKCSSALPNVKFTMLIDLPKSIEELTDFDKKIIELSDGKFFVRKKVFDGKYYSAYERKRGAICDLNEALIGDSYRKFHTSLTLKTAPEYVVVLDDDSKLLPSSVDKAICEMEHPLNEKFDLFGFGARYNLGSLKTVYSKRYMESAGADYNGASSFYFDNFETAIFCGKGIYRLKQFYKKLNFRIPKGKVLSHDIVEGGFLKTGQSSVFVYEDAPLNKPSEEERQRRWMLGDLLNLRFVFNSDVSAITRLIMFDLAVATLCNAMFFIVALWAAIVCNVGALVIVLALYSMPVIIDFINLLGGISDFAVKFKIKAIGDLILRLVEELLLLIQKGMGAVRMIFGAIFKALLKKNLLCWKTFYQSQTDTGNKLVAMAVPTVLFCVLVGIIGYFVSSFTLIFSFAYLLGFALLFVLYNGTDEKVKEKTISERQKETLLLWGKQTYKYFETFMTDGLPCDNFQEFGGVGKAMRTSPTNIGFSLLSHVCANKLGYVDFQTAFDRISKTVDAVCKMEKWKGNLYNWYDIESKEKLNGFVSSVDSGNFISCLVVVRNFLDEFLHSEVKENKSLAQAVEAVLQKVDKLISDCDFSSLFDKTKNQFYIGYNSDLKKFEGHYDLMSSEIKLTLFTTIALGKIDSSAFYGVSRRSYDGIMLSWSGTAFEYLMPELFLQNFKGSAFDYTRNAVVKKQIKAKCSGFWGISESGHAEVVDNVFQYFAFGLNNLSLRSARNECVISPYSSFLALGVKTNAAMKNLEKMENDAFCGYGFYEAIDFSKGQTVTSYMAHHQGMIMAAIANAVSDNEIVKLYNAGDSFKETSLLLTEPKIKIKGEKQKRDKFVYDTAFDAPIIRVIDKKFIEPKMNGHFGTYSVLLDDFGEGYSIYKNVYVTKPLRQSGSIGQFVIAQNENGEKFSPTFSPLKNFDDYEVVFKRNESVFLNKTKRAKMTVLTNPLFVGEIRRFEFETTEKLKVAFYSDLALNYYGAVLAHTTFSDLMVKTEKDGDFIVASRNNADFCAGMLIKGINVKPITKKTDFFKNVEGDFNDVDFDELLKNENSIGDVICPMLGFAAECEPTGGRVVFDVVISYGEDKASLLKRLSMAKNVNFFDFMRQAIELEKTSEKALLLTQTILPKLLFKEYSPQILQNYSDGDENKYFNKKYLYYSFDGDLTKLKEYARIVKNLKSIGVETELVVGYFEDDSYYEPIKNLLKQAAPNAIFVMSEREVWQEKAFLRLNDLTVVTNEQYVLKKPVYREVVSEDIDEDIEFKSGNGGYTVSGYFLKTSEKTRLPYSNVICDVHGGFVTTNNGLAFSYLKNSRLNRITDFVQDEVVAPSSERLYALWQNKWANLYRCNYYVKPKITMRKFVSKEIEATIYEYLCHEGKFKVTEIDVEEIKDEIKLVSCADISLGDEKTDLILSKISGDCVYFTNLRTGQNCAFRAVDGIAANNKAKFESRIFKFPFDTKSSEFKIGATLEIDINKEGACYFVSGEVNGIENLSTIDFEIARKAALNYKSPFVLSSDDKALDRLFNALPNQVESSRFYGRCGYYQTGGAIGFRDQLQDCLCEMFVNKSAVRDLILNCAKHQYEQGDVQHWWHEPKLGVRTKITDDRLFLPFITAIYVKFSGDYSILHEKIEYLSSPLLENKSRYENPVWTDYKETLLNHIEKAVNSALNFGENGLLKIGGGDWNDALDEVGNDEKGESVWLTEFMVLTLEEIKDFYNGNSKIEIINLISKLKSAIEKTYANERYARLVTKDGEWLGVQGGKIEIDAISQAFASLIGLDKERVKYALNSALSLLDEEYKIVKLLSPPLSEKGYGYISDYPLGVRENGGQYTHGAVWLALGFLNSNDAETAYKILSALNPLSRCTDKKLNDAYMGEPYVLAGDVYTNSDNLGRMGWSWYTGSAAWYFVSVLKMFGIELKENTLLIKPCLPKALYGAKLTFEHNNSVIKITYVQSSEFKIKINGTVYEGVEGLKIIPDRVYNIEVFC